MKRDDTNNITISSKTAIVVIHGMGNQYPMDTISDFVENLFDGIKFSTPERVSGSLDHRKLIGFHKKIQYDCYEYYWAHLVKEPDLSNTIFWLYRLLWRKTLSERLKEFIVLLRVITFVLPLFIIFFFYFYYIILVCILYWHPFWCHILFFVVSIIVFYILKYCTNLFTQIFGDVIRYTIPHPSSLEFRQKISNNAVEFLTNLHKKDYSRIVIVGHSLGSIIAYEMIINTFGQFTKEFAPTSTISENFAKQISAMKTQDLRRDTLGNFFKWKVSDFISCGSPLCHAKMIMVENEEMFDKKVEKGEYPVCPPERDNLFYDFRASGNFTPTHDSVFGFVNWNNLYFTNDPVGGDLKNIFKKGIINKKIIPITYKGIRISHIQYWNKNKELESHNFIKSILKI